MLRAIRGGFAVAVLVALAACSSDASDGGATSTVASAVTSTEPVREIEPTTTVPPTTESSTTTTSSTITTTSTTTTTATLPPTTTIPRPVGPAATIDGPLTGGKGIVLGASTSTASALEAAGYIEREYTASGAATSYTSIGELPTDGRFELQPGSTAEYVTRIVVRRPADPDAFSGTVVLEWLNVSAGLDGAAEYRYQEAELLRSGAAWVGVSAQRIGVEGGPVAVSAPGSAAAGAGQGLRAIDPERYGQLRHPGDAHSYDIYTQVARALRGHDGVDPLAGLDVQSVLAIGESQSAFALTTYCDGVQPLTKAFDGFLLHSRSGAATPLETPSGYIDVGGTIFGPTTLLRTDEPTPVIVVQTESDVLGIIGFYPARQPDDEHLRIWEVAGTAHADAFPIPAEREAALGCATAINRGQQVYVLRAALRHLAAWATGGSAPPSAEPLAVDESSGTPSFVLDDVGNVVGGVRTPVVDVPVDVLSGLVADVPSVLCLLLSSTVPLPPERLAERYPDAHTSSSATPRRRT